MRVSRFLFSDCRDGRKIENDNQPQELEMFTSLLSPHLGTDRLTYDFCFFFLSLFYSHFQGFKNTYIWTEWIDWQERKSNDRGTREMKEWMGEGWNPWPHGLLGNPPLSPEPSVLVARWNVLSAGGRTLSFKRRLRKTHCPANQHLNWSVFTLTFTTAATDTGLTFRLW